MILFKLGSMVFGTGKKGEKLLEKTNLTIDVIANRVGFDSTAHFRKVFESRFFCSPKEYRKNLN